eukprot:1160751-Pelagomonas_calceolata.AAC.2
MKSTVPHSHAEVVAPEVVASEGHAHGLLPQGLLHPPKPSKAFIPAKQVCAVPHTCAGAKVVAFAGSGTWPPGLMRP